MKKLNWINLGLLLLLVYNIAEPAYTAITWKRDYIPVEVSKYVTSFESEYNVKVTYPVIFVTNITDAAQCYFAIKHITVNKDFWDTLNDMQREQLLYHEMGHCSLNLDHDTRTATFKGFEGEHPYSIMYPVAFNLADSVVYTKYHAHFIDQLRHGQTYIVQ